MILYIVRHGLAVGRTDPHAPADPERPLTRKGIEKTRAAMQGLRKIGARPDAMFTSPYLRAAQTAEIACEAFGFSFEKLRKTNSLKPGSNPADFLKELATVKTKETMCFGHAPHLDQLIAHLAGARGTFTELKKAGVACFEIELANAAKGVLRWIAPPKILRSMD